MLCKPGISVSVFARYLILANPVTKASKGLGMVNFTNATGAAINSCFEHDVRNLALGFIVNALTKLMPSNLVWLDSQ